MFMEGHLQHAFSYSVQLAKENYLFEINGIGQLTVQLTQEN